MQGIIYPTNCSFHNHSSPNMKDRLERFVLLPFSAGCISESSIPVVAPHHPKRSKHPTTHTHPGCEEKHEEDEEQRRLGDEESLSGQNLKTNLPRVQKMLKNFKNFSQLFVYKDELEPEMGMEIGLPTDVKHVTHIGLDGCASSIFSNGWNDLARQELINLHSFPLSELELAIKAQAQTPNIMSLLQTKCHFNNNVIAQ